MQRLLERAGQQTTQIIGTGCEVGDVHTEMDLAELPADRLEAARSGRSPEQPQIPADAIERFPRAQGPERFGRETHRAEQLVEGGLAQHQHHHGVAQDVGPAHPSSPATRPLTRLIHRERRAQDHPGRLHSIILGLRLGFVRVTGGDQRWRKVALKAIQTAIAGWGLLSFVIDKAWGLLSHAMDAVEGGLGYFIDVVGNLLGQTIVNAAGTYAYVYLQHGQNESEEADQWGAESTQYWCTVTMPGTCGHVSGW